MDKSVYLLGGRLKAGSGSTVDTSKVSTSSSEAGPCGHFYAWGTYTNKVSGSGDY